MTEQLEIVAQMLQLSKSVKTLKDSKSKIESVRIAIHREAPELRSKFSLLENDISTKTKIYKHMIEARFKDHPDFNAEIHCIIDYITDLEIENKYANCGLTEEDDFYLDLTTGQIVPITEVPEDKRSR